LPFLYCPRDQFNHTIAQVQDLNGKVKANQHCGVASKSWKSQFRRTGVFTLFKK
jgi:hypothetical protein